MLVKFLSFVASVFGTARYKAIFLSCLAVALSITGVTAVALFKNNGDSHTAASNVGKSEKDAKKEDTSPQLGASSQSAKNADQNQAPAPGVAEERPSQPSNSVTMSSPKESDPENVSIAVSADKVTVAPGATSDFLTATVSDKSNVTWTVKPVNEGDEGIHAIINQNNTAPSVTFQIQASQDLKSGTIIHLLATARDAARNINLSKQITVTIQ